MALGQEGRDVEVAAAAVLSRSGLLGTGGPRVEIHLDKLAAPKVLALGAVDAYGRAKKQMVGPRTKGAWKPSAEGRQLIELGQADEELTRLDRTMGGHRPGRLRVGRHYPFN